MNDQIEWKKDYTIGIDRIDHQHQYFVNLINWLGESMDLSLEPWLEKRYIEEVIQYAKFHFVSEENYMHSIGYEETEAHKELHGDLLDTLHYHITRLELKKEGFRELIEFLKEWFINHTLNEDKKIARLIKA